MRVIFEKNFLEDLKRLDNTLKITKFVIGTAYNNYTLDSDFISGLFSGNYLYNDVRKTSEYPLYSIWENNEKVLKINIDISEDEKENLVEPASNFCFIYCYAYYPNRSENIAFILTEINESSNQFSKLDINIISNLIEVKFPEYTKAYIETIQDSDTNFLEGIGIDPGINIFTETGNNITTKRSYYKYLRNTKTSGFSECSFLYNNISGEKIYNNSIKKIITEINLFSTLGAVENSGILEDNTLKKSGGYVNLLGTFTCDIYRIINDYNIFKIKENVKIDITSLPVIDLEIIENTGINFSIDQINKKLVYTANSTRNKLQASIKLKIIDIDPMTSNKIELKSKELILLQSN